MKPFFYFILPFVFSGLTAKASLVESKSRLDFWPGPVDTSVDVSTYRIHSRFITAGEPSFISVEKETGGHFRPYTFVLFSLALGAFSYYAGFARGKQKE